MFTELTLMFHPLIEVVNTYALVVNKANPVVNKSSYGVGKPNHHMVSMDSTMLAAHSYRSAGWIIHWSDIKRC